MRELAARAFIGCARCERKIKPAGPLRGFESRRAITSNAINIFRLAAHRGTVHINGDSQDAHVARLMFAKLRRSISAILDDSRFVIQIVDGNVHVARGKVPNAFLRELRDFLKEEAVLTGTLRGKRQETYIRLVFSPEIPSHLHQKLRNIWHSHEPNFQMDSP